VSPSIGTARSAATKLLCSRPTSGESIARFVLARQRMRFTIGTEVKLRWPLLPMILTSGHPLERIRELPPGVAYMPKPWKPLNVLIATEQALALRV
jgi:hypothetical protein